ncbi:phiSA1p31-related protein [Streptomyces eurythermus]
MTERFEVGQKVKHGTYGREGVVTYGPFKSTFGEDSYLVRKDNGTEATWFGRNMSVVPEPPKLTVGDKARGAYSGVVYTVEAGPFDDNGYIWYATREPSGAVGYNSADDLEPVDEPEPIKVGDRVRVVRATWADECRGLTGTVDSIDHDFHLDGTPHPYHVALDGRASGVHASSVERIDEPAADTYKYNGVVYDLSARYRDKDGDVWRFERRPDGIVRGVWTNRDIVDYDCKLDEVADDCGPLTRVDTYTHDGVTYDLSAKYTDGHDTWVFTGRKNDVGAPYVTCFGNMHNTETIGDIADAFGPLSRVND